MDEDAGMRDAFAFLLEELDHEDLERSLAIESARDAGPVTPSIPASVPVSAAPVHAQDTSAGGGGGFFANIAMLQQFAPYLQFAQYATPQMVQQFMTMASAPGGSAGLLASLQSMTSGDGGAGLMASLAAGANGAELLASLANGSGGSSTKPLANSENASGGAGPLASSGNGNRGGDGLMTSMLGGEGLSLTPFLKQTRPAGDTITISVVAPSDLDVAAATSIALSLISEEFERNDSGVKSISNNDSKEGDTGAAKEQDQEQEPQLPRKPMENSTRKRQKEELAYLRDKVRELESELKVTQDRARASAALSQTEGEDSCDRMQANAGESQPENLEDEEKCPAPSSQQQQQTDLKSEASAAVAVVPVSKLSLWERVAKRQLIEKQKAETKNLKLKEALEDQLKIAKSLEKVLKKRPSATISTQVLDSVQVVNSKRFCSLSRSEANIYDMLIANTEKVYAELDDVCARNEYMQVNEDVNDTKLMVDSSNQLYMEITHAKIIPFDMATTIDGIWRCLSLAYVPIADGSYEAVERTADTICAKSTMAFTVKNTQAIVHTRFVMKKFVEKDRVVLACESSTQSEGPRDIVHGLKCLEKGWVVIKPVRSKDDGAPSSTIIQLCMRMTPTISGEMLETQRRQAGAVTDVILGSFNKSLVLLYQAMENIIMETVVPAREAKKHKKG